MLIHVHEIDTCIRLMMLLLHAILSPNTPCVMALDGLCTCTWVNLLWVCHLNKMAVMSQLVIVFVFLTSFTWAINVNESIIFPNENVLRRLVQYTLKIYNNPEYYKNCSCSQLSCRAKFTNGVCTGRLANQFGSALISTFGGDCSHNCTNRKVDMTKGTVRRSANSMERDLQYRIEACWTAPLDQEFNRTLRIENSTLRWQYIGTPSGLHRLFPGIPQEQCQSYDPTVRPWYVAAISGRKNVVMVLDVSDSTKDFGRLDRLKEAAKGALRALDNFDYVGIVVFGDVAKPLMEDVLIIADQEGRSNLFKAIDNVETMGGTNYEDAFRKAFEMISNSIIHGNIAICNTAMLFVTDGVPTIGERSEDKLISLIKDLNRFDSPAKIFTYVLGESTRTILPKRIACETGGFFTLVPDNVNFVDKFTRHYAEFFSLLRESKEVVEPVWVEPYDDAFGLGNVTTVSQPVYDSQSKLIAVIGIDVSVANLRQAAGDNDSAWKSIIQDLANRAVCPNFTNTTEFSLDCLRQEIGVELCDVDMEKDNCSELLVNTSSGPKVHFSDVSPLDFCPEKRTSYEAEICCPGVRIELAANTTCTSSRSVYSEDILNKTNADNAVRQTKLLLVTVMSLCVVLLL